MTDTSVRPTPKASGTIVGVVVGLLSILTGILVLAWPRATLLLVAVLFGVQLVFLGGARVLTALQAGLGSSQLV